MDEQGLPAAALDEVTAEDLADSRVIHDALPESIELATYSAAVLRVPMSVARSDSRKDLVYRPVVDADRHRRSQLGWPPTRTR